VAFYRIEIVLHEGKHGQNFWLVIDGLPLHKHFAGRTGSHPTPAYSLGSPSGSQTRRESAVRQLLLEEAPTLASGRVALLVCEECGDIACGAIAARLSVGASGVEWTDWAYENGYEPAREHGWPVCPERFAFSRAQYEEAIRAIVAHNNAFKPTAEEGPCSSEPPGPAAA
jgi:hypothetical protein